MRRSPTRFGRGLAVALPLALMLWLLLVLVLQRMVALVV